MSCSSILSKIFKKKTYQKFLLPDILILGGSMHDKLDLKNRNKLFLADKKALAKIQDSDAILVVYL